MATTLENTLIRFNDGTTQSTAATTPPAASTTVAGIVQLSTETNSTSTTLAATASAVKAAYDLAAGKLSSLVPSNKGVGEVVVAWNTTTSNVAAGSTIAGSSLRHSSGISKRDPFSLVSIGLYNAAFPTTDTAALSGTWRAIVFSSGRYVTGGGVDNPYITYYWPGLFIRIS